ncbi:hypothetical protein SEA_EVAA_79 [Gordonia phage Evaa]|nr:hypothetical protein SEA_EVAA_79 [Gordonia phage Evaa]
MSGFGPYDDDPPEDSYDAWDDIEPLDTPSQRLRDVYGHTDDGSTYYEDQARERERRENWERRVYGRVRDDLRIPRSVPTPTLPMLRERRTTLVGLFHQLGWDLPANYPSSLHTFRGNGLSDEAMAYLVAVTMIKADLPADARWRYFCGCCWRTIQNGR